MTVEEDLWAGKYVQGFLYRVITECQQIIDLAEPNKAEQKLHMIFCPFHQKYEPIATLVRRVRIN